MCPWICFCVAILTSKPTTQLLNQIMTKFTICCLGIKVQDLRFLRFQGQGLGIILFITPYNLCVKVFFNVIHLWDVLYIGMGFEGIMDSRKRMNYHNLKIGFQIAPFQRVSRNRQLQPICVHNYNPHLALGKP